LSIVISAYNEEAKLARTLKSIQWADEIIVVDNESTDGTKEIAKKYHATVYTRPNKAMLNENKNFGFTKATQKWILNLDADEEIPEELAQEIKKNIDNDEIDGYWISRKNIIFGKWIQHGLWWPDRQLRLFQKNKGEFPCKHVHEYVEVKGKTAQLAEPFIHYNYETVSQYLHKLDTIYTENEVLNKQKNGYVLMWHDAVRFPVSDFVKIYFAQEGYKDGLHGLVLALLQSFYSLIVFAKLWEKEKFTEKDIHLSQIASELKRAEREIHYWELTSHINENKSIIDKLVSKVKRRYVTSR
jgi:(heptosyl)LPS beta-1,4-glucosyltransferase